MKAITQPPVDPESILIRLQTENTFFDEDKQRVPFLLVADHHKQLFHYEQLVEIYFPCRSRICL